MAEPFLSEIRIMSFDYPPKGWALCNGQLMPINQNQALFSLLGTTFGGDGRVTFSLPNLEGKVPIGVGSGHTLGEVGGASSHTVSISQMPAHFHVANSSAVAANTNTATANALLGVQASTYTAAANLTAMSPTEIGNTGGSQAHQNMQPFLALNFSIALVGIFPSPN